MTESSLHGWDSARLRALVMNVPGAIYRCSPSNDWAMEFISDEVEAITGYPADEFVHNRVRTYASVMIAEDRLPIEVSVAETLSRRESYEIEYRVRHRDGSIRWVQERGQGILGDDGTVAFLDGVICDVTDRKRAEERLGFLAYHDSLTGLPNRLLFQDHLRTALASADDAGARVAVLFIDLDGFKLVNDSFGHSIGDELLIEVARRLTAIVGSGDVVARQSGDEFLVLLASLPNGRRAEDVVTAMALSVQEALKRPISLSGTDVTVSASIGISIYPDEAADGEALLKHADIAMYRAKEHGRNDHALYVSDGSDPRRQLTLATRLGRAIANGEMVLHYQPLVELATGSVVGAEALVRWDDGDRGLIAPGEFIPIAERTGLIKPLSDWVIDQACQQTLAWSNAGMDLYVSVNLPASFWRPTAMREVLDTIESFGLNPNRMMIEITESTMMTGERSTAPILAELHRRGLRVAVDDFGTGHSSLSRLTKMLVTTLKIDQSFVAELPEDASAAILVRSIIQLAHNLGLQPLAEGIETREQAEFLIAHGCTLGQGFLFSHPVPAAEFARLRGKLYVAAA